MKLNRSIEPALTPKNRQRAGLGLAKWMWSALLPIVIIGAILIGITQVKAPNPVASSAPPEVFSAERAMEKLQVIAKEPHPLLSSAHDRVRDYLMDELRALGLEPEIQKEYAVSDYSALFKGMIENIVVKIPGTDSSKAVMIAAHYDSVRTGPGAGDDGAAIAAMLETVRALQASGPLKNDLILLMTDGEEYGLLGAKAFVEKHPWVKDVGLVLNFEARGNRGPSFMFETSGQNGWLVQEYVKADPYPVAYSLIYNVYKIMPNDTDMTMFLKGGLTGLNFAFGEGVNAYHSPIDTPENLDQSSLQHHGEHMLSLTKHFGNLDLNAPQVEQPDRIYFNVLGWKMISYPQSWNYGLLVIAALVFLATLWHGFARKRLSLLGMTGGFLVTMVNVGVIFGVIKLLWALLGSILAEDTYVLVLTDPKVSLYVFVGTVVCTVLLQWGMMRWGTFKIRVDNVWAGVLLLWFLLSIALVVWLPGGSYMFIWPLLFSMAGFNLVLAVAPRMLDLGHLQGMVSVLAAVPGIVLFTPIVYLIYILMTMQMAGPIMAIAALPCLLIAPALMRSSK